MLGLNITVVNTVGWNRLIVQGKHMRNELSNPAVVLFMFRTLRYIYCLSKNIWRRYINNYIFISIRVISSMVTWRYMKLWRALKDPKHLRNEFLSVGYHQKRSPLLRATYWCENYLQNQARTWDMKYYVNWQNCNSNQQ